MDYSIEILEKIDIINHALKELDRQPLFENADFLLDENSSAVYLKFYLKKRVEDIAITIILSCFEIQIDIDRVNEAFVWDNEAIQKDRNGVFTFLGILFLSTIRVKNCGRNYTKLYFINNKGICVKSIKYVTGVYWKINCSTKEYLPIYE